VTIGSGREPRESLRVQSSRVSPTSNASTAALDWRTNVTILIGMLVPIAALAIMGWLSAPATPRSSTIGGVAASGRAGHVGPPRQLKVEVLASYPHDPSAFTQGLHYEGNGVFYESTGLEGQSTLRRVDLKTGGVLKAFALAPDLFGEGVARTPRALLQLTYRNQVALIYDPASLTVIGQFTYPGEGWGVCFDGERLVMSDGSDTLTFRRRTDFVVERSLRVTLDGAPLAELNELEAANGGLYANVWRKPFIVRIDPATGAVAERIDASGLLTEAEARNADVLNGIAYDRSDDTFYITGKRWPKLFKVRFVPAGS
jgi:glutaminyl-peptide cyclotransferase